ncbi:MAG TPA: CRISPR-associated protein Cas4 [Candidatus Blautia excrementipullorum]|nr:CRISPR-associated protein Cas4 [Candidatus Blautia excrementipullorum]
MNTAEITIRSIQHYLYCPHRWGLLEIDKAWAENIFVTKANLMHERVHDPERNYTSRGKKVFTSVPVYNDQEKYNLYGVTDCLELTESSSGTAINESGEKYKICIVEYKPTKPKDMPYREDDLMQVFAQKICVDYVFGSDCEGVIYYSDVRKRIALPLRENFQEYDKKLQNVLREMREHLASGKIPAIRKGQKCSGCSMKDLCMPSIKSVPSLRAEIKKIGEAMQ